MNLQLLGSRCLLLGPRFPSLLLSRCYAVKGMTEGNIPLKRNENEIPLCCQRKVKFEILNLIKSNYSKKDWNCNSQSGQSRTRRRKG